MKKRTPIALREGDSANFGTLQKAFENGDSALISAVRKSDGADVALVCAMGRSPDGQITLAPLAVMIEGDPYELFEDPTV